LYAGIGKHHGGIGTFIDHFGGDSSRNPDGHWKDMDNVRAEFRMILEKHPELDGRVPSSHWLQTRGYSYLAAGIYHSQGSFGEVRKQLILEFGSGDRQRKELEALLTDYVEGGRERRQSEKERPLGFGKILIIYWMKLTKFCGGTIV
jgi:hypothetical protein